MKLNLSTTKLARAGIISALYAAVSFISAPIASGAIQIRLSEALCLLPLIFPESILGLTIGCALSNLITGLAPYDVIFGSLITLIASVFTYLCGKIIKKDSLKIFIGGLFPVLLNAFFLPLIWKWCYGFIEYVYLLQVLFLIIGQGVSVYAIGTPLYFIAKKNFIN